MSIRQFGFIGAIMLASAAGALGQVPPPNDDFANRTVVTGSSITFTGTLAGATLESAETNSSFPGSLPSGGSVWWSWTAPESTTVVIAILWDSSANITSTRLHIYSGTDLNALTVLDANRLGAPSGRYVTFAATAGVSYQFRVAGGSGGGSSGETFTLRLTATNPPVFLIQPQDCAVSPYGSAFFSAMASEPPAGSWTRYQWTFNGISIPDQTGPSLVVPGVTTNQAGSYAVIASNVGGLTPVGGVTQSAAAMLTVTETNPVPRLAAFSPTDPALLSFSLTGEGGRWYKIESSQDLQNWLRPSWLQVTNATSLVSVPRIGPSHFVRASLNVSTDVCVAQLRQLLWAQCIFAIEHRLPPTATVTLQQLHPFLPLGADGLIRPCPESGYYSPGAFILDNPTCSLHSHGHVIPNP